MGWLESPCILVCWTGSMPVPQEHTQEHTQGHTQGHTQE